MVYVIGLASWAKARKPVRKNGRGVQNGEPFKGSRCWLHRQGAQAHLNALDRDPQWRGKFAVYPVDCAADNTYAAGDGGVRRLVAAASIVIA